MNDYEHEDDDGCMGMLAFWGTVTLLFLGTVMHHVVGWLA